MAIRLTTFHDIHDEFYYPTGMKKRDRRPLREVGYDMGRRGVPVTSDFLDFRARLYNGQLNAATHTIDQRADYVSRRTNDMFRNLSLLVLAVVGFIIVALAMFVDYKILHDFWTSIYSNEFLEVPQSLKDNVVFKSLQVLFAVIALHFLISQSGWFGSAIRGVFMVGTGIMVLGMLVGLGLLSAKATLPQSASIQGISITEASGASSASDKNAILESLGLKSSVGITPSNEKPAVAASSDEGLTAQKLQDYETYIFFGTFGLIFLFVSSVGALCLHYSLHALESLFGGTESERRERAIAGHHYFFKAGEWRPKTRKDLDDQRHRINHARMWIGDSKYRASLMDRFFAEFAAGYMDGLMDRMNGKGFFGGKMNRDEFDQLRDDMKFAVQSAADEWTPEAIQATLPQPEVRQMLGYRSPEEAERRGFLGFGGYRRTPDYSAERDTVEILHPVGKGSEADKVVTPGFGRQTG